MIPSSYSYVFLSVPNVFAITVFDKKKLFFLISNNLENASLFKFKL